MTSRTIKGCYGSGHTDCELIVVDLDDGTSWYAVRGSQNVNLCDTDLLVDYVWVEDLPDIDSMGCDPINSEGDLIDGIDE